MGFKLRGDIKDVDLVKIAGLEQLLPRDPGRELSEGLSLTLYHPTQHIMQRYVFGSGSRIPGANGQGGIGEGGRRSFLSSEKNSRRAVGIVEEKREREA